MSIDPAKALLTADEVRALAVRCAGASADDESDIFDALNDFAGRTLTIASRIAFDIPWSRSDHRGCTIEFFKAVLGEKICYGSEIGTRCRGYGWIYLPGAATKSDREAATEAMAMLRAGLETWAIILGRREHERKVAPILQAAE